MAQLTENARRTSQAGGFRSAAYAFALQAGPGTVRTDLIFPLRNQEGDGRLGSRSEGSEV